LAEDAKAGRRYDAACYAARAAAGQGADAATLDDTERARWRWQALDWLRADLDAWRGLWDKEPGKARPVVAQKMRHWLRDPDLNGVRGPDALAKLPEAERKEWQRLWADVAALLADDPREPGRAGGTPPAGSGVRPPTATRGP